MSVASGSAEVTAAGIRTTDKAVLNWKEFSIQKGEVVRFIQPDELSSCLNRVTGSQMSRILGRLESNGKVYLINPQGLFIGPDAVIDTAGFIGSTFDVLDEDYLKGQMNFSHKSDAKIVHLGKINCPDGEVTLFARQVENEGEIVGTDILLKAEGVYIKPEGELNGSTTYAYGVRSSGTVEAVTSAARDGRIYLISENARTEVTGDLTASGEVAVLGDQVSVFEEARLTAGESVLVGGDFQGKNPDIMNSTMTYVGEDVVLTAHEGKVIVWSDGVTGFFGHADTSGNESGGFIEVSGLNNLTYQGTTNRSAVNGDPGTLLLDPTDITVTAAATSGGSFIAGVFTPSAASANILNTDLNTELAGGPVTISTVSGFGGTGDLTFSSPVTWAAANKLTCTAERQIFITASIASTNAGVNFDAMEFNANQQVTPTTGTFEGILMQGTSASVTTVSGNLVFNGKGGDTGANNRGVVVSSRATVSSTGTGASAGSITMNGTSQGGTTTNAGVALTGLFGVGSVTSLDGAISLTGTGTGTTTNNYGVFLNDMTVSSTGGAITFNGTSLAGTMGASGIFINTNSVVTSATGDIMMTGTGGVGTLNNNEGVGITASSVSSTGTTAATASNITIRGTGGTGSVFNNGVRIDSNLTSVEGTITLIGDGGTGTSNNAGVVISNTGGGKAVSSENGNISITGTAISTGNSNAGIVMSSGGIIESTGTDSDAATITMMGTGSASGTNNSRGIFNGDGLITSVSGDMMITGIGGGTGFNNNGIRLATSSASITSTGSSPNAAAITMIGTGGPGTTLNDGIASIGGTISTVDGNLSMTGTSLGTTATNLGISNFSGSIVSTGSGTLTLMGTGADGTSANYGVRFRTGATLTSTAAVNITGIGGVGSSSFNGGVSIEGGSSVTGSMSAPVTITGTAKGGVSLNIGINLDGASSNVSTVNGNLMMIGSCDNTYSSNGNDGITINSTCSVSSSGTGTVTLMGTAGLGPTDNVGVRVTGSSALVANTSTGAVNVTGVGRGTAGDNHGISLEGSGGRITGASGLVTLNGTGAAGTDDNYGIYITGLGSSVTASTGSSLTGLGQGTGSSNDGIHMDASGRIDSTSTGSITLMGTGSASGASGDNNGVFLTGGVTEITSSGTISVTGIGGDEAGIVLESGSSIAGLAGSEVTVDGTGGSEYGIDVNGLTTIVSALNGKVTAVGRDSGGTEKGLHVTENGQIISLGSAEVDVSTMSDILLENGGQIVGGTGAVTVASSRDIIINASFDPLEVTGIILDTGSASITATRDIVMTGTSEPSSPAQIGSRRAAGSTAAISFPLIGRDLILDSSRPTSPVFIGHGDPAISSVFGGNITATVGGNISLTGATLPAAGSLGVAQIGHIDAGGSTLSGNINLTAAGSISLTGGTTTASSFARIGHGGQGAGTVTSSAMTIRAGTNLIMTSNAAPAQIENLATAGGSGDLTLVVDNLFPTSPNFGTGAFTLNSDLNATGELRIYTVTPVLNSINDLINGAVFVGGPFNEDSNTEQYGIYFPGGTFGGAVFKIYYKVGGQTQVIIATRVIDEIFVQSVATAELEDRLPNFHYMHLGNYPPYHGEFCQGGVCDPSLDPYGSFIFEDNIYWIGSDR